jgi:hypothetical protein
MSVEQRVALAKKARAARAARAKTGVRIEGQAGVDVSLPED